MSLVLKQFVKISNGNITNTLLFFIEKIKCENPLHCKGFSHFFKEKITVYLLVKLIYSEQIEG